MIQRLERHARRHGAIADDRHHAAILAGVRRRHRHAERGRDRGARVSDAEGVVLALRARRERREPAVLLDRMQPFAPSGEHLVRIGLMPDVPDQEVPRGLIHVVQRNGELDRSEPSREVTAASADRLDEELAQLTGERGGACSPGTGAGRPAPRSHRAAGTCLEDCSSLLFTRAAAPGLGRDAQRVHCARAGGSAHASDHEVGELCQCGGAAAERRQGGDGVIAQLARHALVRSRARRCSGRSAWRARHRRRSTCRAPAGHLRRRGCRPGSWKARTDVRAETLEGSHPGTIAHPCGQGAEQHASLDESPGLAAMHVLDRSHRERLPHGREINCLTAGHAAGAGRARQHTDHLEPLRRAVAGHRIVRQHGKASACSASPTRIAVASS